MRKSFLRTPVSICAALVLAGCATSQIDQAVYRSDFDQAVQLFEREYAGKYDTLSHQQNFNVCWAMLSVKRFGRFFQCYEALDAKVKANDGKFMMAGNMTPERSEVQLKDLRTQAYLEIGSFEKARVDAERIIELSQGSNLSRFDNPGMRAFEYVASWGLVASMEAEEAELARVTPYGVLSIIEARSGNEKQAREWMGKLESLPAGGFMGVIAGYGGRKQTWLAKTAFVLEDYQKAYDIMSAPEEIGAGGAMARGLMGFAMAFPTTPVVMMGMTGRVDYGDLTFFARFEPKFILHRSELEIGKLAEARKGYDEILAEPRVQGFGSVLFMALHGRGKVAEKENQIADAISYYKRAVAVLEAQRASIGNEKGRIGFVGNKQDVYEDLIKLLVVAGRSEEAFEYAERGKARALVDLLATKDKFASKIDTAKAQQLLEEIDRTTYASMRQAGDERQMAMVRATAHRARQELKTLAPEVSSLVSVDVPGVSVIQELLPPDDTLVEYFGAGDGLYAFVVSRHAVSAVRLDGKGIEKVIRAYRDGIYDPASSAHVMPARELYVRLLQPVMGDVRTRNVTIVPHGALHYIPFAALQDDRGQALIDRYGIRVLPSASVLPFLTKPRSGQLGEMLALGNPDLGNPEYDLPAAQEEAVAIIRGRGQSRLLQRKQASETMVKGAAGGFRYLHFATHGEFDPGNPLDSALLLSGDGENDGRLTAAELYDIDLNAELVTLSACETGLGVIAHGDDVVGLTRGFLFAGSRTIVASLWKVGDEFTSLLMQDFYRNLEMMDKRSALRAAQLKLRREGYTHPYYWAAFQLTGGL